MIKLVFLITLLKLIYVSGPAVRTRHQNDQRQRAVPGVDLLQLSELKQGGQQRIWNTLVLQSRLKNRQRGEQQNEGSSPLKLRAPLHSGQTVCSQRASGCLENSQMKLS